MCLFGLASRCFSKAPKSNSTAKRSVLLSKSIDFLTFEVAFGLLKIIPNLPLSFLTNYKKTTVYNSPNLLFILFFLSSSFPHTADILFFLSSSFPHTAESCRS